MKLELYGLVIASGIVLTMKNAVFTPLYAAYVLEIQKNTFFLYQISGIVFFIFVFLITKILAMIIISNSLLSLMAIVLTSGIIATFILAIYLLRDQEMAPLVNSILEKIKLKKISRFDR